MSSTMLQLNAFESPPGGLPPERERAIRHLLESVARETLHGGKRRGRSPQHRPGLPLRLGLATVTTVLLAAGSLVIADVLRPDAEVAHAATPPLVNHEMADGVPADDVLTELASHAAASGNVTTSTVQTERWSLAVTVNGPATNGPAPEGAAPEGAAPEGAAPEGAAAEGVSGQGAPAEAVTTAIIPVLTEVIWHPDGSTSVWQVGGEPQFPDDAYRRVWNDAGQPGSHGQVLRDETLPPGEYARVFPAELPTTPARLKALLIEEQPAARDDSGALLLAIHDLRNEQQLGGDVRAGLLTMLAAEPDVMSLGEITDRAGRPALAIAVDSDHSGWPSRYVLLLDPRDGRILGYERVLTEPVGPLDVAAPAIIDYTIFR